MLKINHLDEKKDIRVPVRISDSTNKAILEECKKNNINRSQFIRLLLHIYFEPKIASLNSPNLNLGDHSPHFLLRSNDPLEI